MKKKLFAILLTVCALVLALVGCGGEETIGLETTSYTYAGADIVLRVSNLDKAKEISLKEGETALKDADYSVEGSALTLKDAYLSALAEGDHGYALETDIGAVNFTVKVPQKSTPPDQGDGGDDNPPDDEPELSLTKTAYTYDDEEIVLTITDLDKAKTVSVKEGTAALASENYTVAGNKLTLKDGYLSSLTAGEHNYTVETDIGTVTFKVTVPDRTPSVTPASQTVELAELTADVEVTVTYNGRLLQSLKLNDENVDAANYETNASKLVLKKSFIEMLGVGEHTFTLTTAGGSCTFKVIVTRNKLAFGAKEYTAAADAAFEAPLYGAAEKTLTVTLNGGVLPADKYTVAADKLTIKQEFISSLPHDVYTLGVSAQDEHTQAAVAVGLAPNDVVRIDFDENGAEGRAVFNYAGDHSYTPVEDGIDGASARLTNAAGLFVMGGTWSPKTFTAGQKYRLIFDIKVEDYDDTVKTEFNNLLVVCKWGDVGGRSLGDNFYVWYDNGTTMRYAKDIHGVVNGGNAVKMGDVWHVMATFTCPEGGITLEVESKESATLLLDNIRLLPAEGAGTENLLTVPQGMDMRIAEGQGADKELAFGVPVLGVKVNGAYAAAEHFAVNGNSVTVKKAWLDSLTKGTTTTYTVVTVYGEVSGSVEVPELTLETTSYTFDGSADVTLTVNNLGKAASVTLKNGGTALTVTNDYTVEGDTLTVKASYLSTLQTADDAKAVTFTLETEYGIVTFTVSVPKLEAGTPSVTDDEKEAELADVAEPVTFEIELNNGAFQKLSLKGADVAAEKYETSVQGGTLTLSLKVDYLKELGAGAHEFTVTTTGGECTFTLTLTRNKLAVDETRIAASEGSVSFKLYGTAGKDVKVAFGGMELTKGTHYTLADDTLALKSEFAALLTADIYPVGITAGTENVNVYVAYNTTWDQAIYVDFDGAAAVADMPYARTTTEEVAEGLNGKSMRFTSSGVADGSVGGVLLGHDLDSVSNYHLTFKVKVESVNTSEAAGFNGTMFMVFKAGPNLNIAYLYYRNSACDIAKDTRAIAVSCVPVGDYYLVSIDFKLQSGEDHLEVENWVSSTYILDDVKLFKYTESVPVLNLAEKDFSLVKGTDTDKTINFGAAVFGVKIGGEWATSEQATVGANGAVTFKGSYLATLQQTTNYTVYCNGLTVGGTITVTSVSLTGDSYEYNNDGQDMTFTLERGGQNVSKVELGDHEAKGNDEYTVEGDTLTLKAALLNRILGSAELKVTFSGGSSVTQELTSKKLIEANFEEGGFGKFEGLAPEADLTYEIEESGINGASAKLTCQNKTGKFFLIGGSGYHMTWDSSKHYHLTMKIKIIDIDASTNFVIAGNSCWIPITFGSGADVVYLRYASGELTADKQTLGEEGKCTVTKQEGDYYEVSIEFTSNGNTELSSESWMPGTFLIDDFLLVEV